MWMDWKALLEEWVAAGKPVTERNVEMKSAMLPEGKKLVSRNLLKWCVCACAPEQPVDLPPHHPAPLALHPPCYQAGPLSQRQGHAVQNHAGQGVQDWGMKHRCAVSACDHVGRRPAANARAQAHGMYMHMCMYMCTTCAHVHVHAHVTCACGSSGCRAGLVVWTCRCRCHTKPYRVWARAPVGQWRDLTRAHCSCAHGSM